MNFNSILFKKKIALSLETPECFIDLNLNQVIDAVVLDKEQYNLKPFFFTSLSNIDEIIYRQEIMKDIENTLLFNYIESFARNMQEMRHTLSNATKYSFKYQKERLFLDSVEMYCNAIIAFTKNLSLVNLKSSGFLSFREYLVNYTQSIPFTSLHNETQKLLADLSSIKYCIATKDLHVHIRHYNTEKDYSVEIEQTFEKFKQDAVRDYRIEFDNWPEMDHIEASILDGVIKLFPVIFQGLDSYCVKNADYLDKQIADFDREVQFYIAWLKYIEKTKQVGMRFCYPKISNTDKDIFNYEGFDLALATKLVKEKTP